MSLLWLASCCICLHSFHRTFISLNFRSALLRNPSLAGIFTGDIRVQAFTGINGTV